MSEGGEQLLSRMDVFSGHGGPLGMEESLMTEPKYVGNAMADPKSTHHTNPTTRQHTQQLEQCICCLLLVINDIVERCAARHRCVRVLLSSRCYSRSAKVCQVLGSYTCEVSPEGAWNTSEHIVKNARFSQAVEWERHERRLPSEDCTCHVRT